ncbi:MAG TPA: surface-adhesin E family protein [Leptolyngbya sp.]|nr:surface-adhesin E family protein [Leptolyngbya sp.]
MRIINQVAAVLGSAAVLFANVSIASAADWTKVTENSVKDQFFVDTSSIQRDGEIAWYWEYREFPEANNAFLEAKVDQPVHGAVIRWSADCSVRAQRLRKVNAYTTNRKLIDKFDYGDEGMLLKPKAGSSTYQVLEYVCRSPQKQ